MIFPSINVLMEKVDSRYTLVCFASRRARQIIEGAQKLTNCDSEKAVTIAINEIYENKITYVRTKSALK